MTNEVKTGQRSDWDNYWQGRTGQTSGAALVGVENNPAIMSFWSGKLSEFSRQLDVLDVACGAGTVLKILSELSFENLHGVDISDAAINVLATQLPNVSGKVSSLEKMPYEDKSFDLLVSQFGFEYSDWQKTIPEIARILSGEGVFMALSHKTGSAIHSEVVAKLNQINRLKDIDIFPLSKELFTAAKTGKAGRSMDDIGREFSDKRIELESLAKESGGLAGHYLSGVHQMYERRHNYDLQDILAWIDGNESEMQRFIGRMKSMDKAALDEGDIGALQEAFDNTFMNVQKPYILKDDNGSELGWIIIARK